MGVFKRKVKSKKGTTEYWYIRYPVNGKDTWKSIGKVGIVTKAVAQAVLNERLRQIRLGQLDMINVDIPTLNDFSDKYIQYVRDVKQNRSWKSAVLYLKKLNEYFGDKKLSQITTKDIEDFKLCRLKDVKPASVNRELACLSHLLNTAKRQKVFFGENPVSECGLLPEHNLIERPLTLDEEERLLKASPPFLAAILITAINTGMRKSEIITLKWANVDFETNLITLDHTNTKSKKTRKIPINSKLRTSLLEQRLKSGKSEFVFLSSKGKPYKMHSSLNQVFRRACKIAGITGFRFYDLRHTTGTRMIESGANIVAVKNVLGHADLKTTMRYVHPEDSVKVAMENLGNFKQ